MIHNMEEYKGLIVTDVCMFCQCPGLDKQPIRAYSHESGWEVEGYHRRQWLYVTCPKCEYDWALWKLGVPRDKP